MLWEDVLTAKSPAPAARSGAARRDLVGCCSRLDNVEGEATLKLHAGGTKDGAQGARGATLLPDHFTDVACGDKETQHNSFRAAQDFDVDGLGVID
jgi:hypothetical protein